MPVVADIIKIDAPASASAGQSVIVDVSVKNISGVNRNIAVTAVYDSVGISFQFDYLTVAPGQTIIMRGNFIMPSKDVRVTAWSWYWDGSNWVLDETGYVDIALVSAVYSGSITDFYFKKGSTYYRHSLGQIPATVVADSQSFEVGVDFRAATTCPGSFFVSCKVVVYDPQGNVYSPTPDRAGIGPGQLLTNWGPFQLPQITIPGTWYILIQFILDNGTVIAIWGPSALFIASTVSAITEFKILDYVKV